jgi:hypothetical protein
MSHMRWLVETNELNATTSCTRIGVKAHILWINLNRAMHLDDEPLSGGKAKGRTWGSY